MTAIAHPTFLHCLIDASKYIGELVAAIASICALIVLGMLAFMEDSPANWYQRVFLGVVMVVYVILGIAFICYMGGNQ